MYIRYQTGTGFILSLKGFFKNLVMITRIQIKTLNDYMCECSVAHKIHPTKPKNYCIVWNEQPQA